MYWSYTNLCMFMHVHSIKACMKIDNDIYYLYHITISTLIVYTCIETGFKKKNYNGSSTMFTYLDLVIILL